MTSVLSLNLENPPSRYDQKDRCMALCQEHFGGAWCELTSPEEFQHCVEPITGATSNTLFVCRLPERFETQKNEPRNVLIRFYGVAKGDSDAILRDSLVFALLSERGIGPRFYGCFPEGRFEEYIPTRCLKTHELMIPRYMAQIAKHMASFHKMDMPLSKDPSTLKNRMYTWYNAWANSTDKLREINPEIWTDIERMNIHDELPKVLRVLEESGSPVLFCHNDFQEGNLLLSPEHDDLIVIDYEYSCYNYRGFDFANHFIEYCYDNCFPDPPYFAENLDNYPSEEKQRAFFSFYLKAQGEVVTSEQQEIDNLMAEAEVFLLATHFQWGLWSFMGALTSTLSFDYMRYGQTRLNAYHKHKAVLKGKYPEKYRDL